MNVLLHPAMTHAQAAHVCHEIGASIHQDGRGNLRVLPISARQTAKGVTRGAVLELSVERSGGAEFTPCEGCRSVLCQEFEVCAKRPPPQRPEAA